MAAVFPKNVRLSARAQEYYSRVFAGTYDSLHNAASHTPLVVMLWGPRDRTRDWSLRRMQIREALEQQGHTAFFSEQLGVPISATAKKGVEFIQSEAADLVVVMQPLYGLVGSVRHFLEQRVVDAKMLLFIDASATDQHLFARALAELQAKYDNVETYPSAEDASQSILLNKISGKVRVMQMVKYRAIQSGRQWGLGPESRILGPAQSTSAAQPFRHNLLELYRAHRGEIDALTSPVSLFLIAFLHHTERISSEELGRDIALSPENLARELKPLLNSELLMWTDGKLEVSAAGHQLLDAVGLTAPPQVRVTVPRPVRWQQTAAWSAVAGVGLAAVILGSIWILNGVGVSQSQQPLELSPAPTSAAPLRTATPTRPTTPLPAPGAPKTTPVR